MPLRVNSHQYQFQQQPSMLRLDSDVAQSKS